MYQKDAAGQRTAAEDVGFRYSLHETMDLWYAHQGTTVYMLTQLPKGSTRQVGYTDSGWTTYERCSAEQIKKFDLLDAHPKWKLVLDLGAAEGASRARRVRDARRDAARTAAALGQLTLTDAALVTTEDAVMTH